MIPAESQTRLASCFMSGNIAASHQLVGYSARGVMFYVILITAINCVPTELGGRIIAAVVSCFIADAAYPVVC